MDKSNEQAACNGEQHEDPVDNMDEESAAKEKLTSDPNKVKFTSVNLDGYDKNGEAKVDIYVAQTTVGMGKEELMKYANEPFWVRLRMFLFVLFWISWLAMLVGAVVIILLAPRCPPAPRLDWYQKTAMYQVDVRTFKDSDGDGIGDFKGLISKLDYFKDHNIGTLLLSSIYESSDNNAIKDYKKLDDNVGTLEDFDELLIKLNEKGIKLVIDFIPNHSSVDHPWFNDSVEKKDPYTDFYIWSDTKNNWLNLQGDSAWTLNEQRGQYYLSTFGYNRPDLNLRNEKVREELKDILRFWLSKGVHGFKVIAASYLIEDADMRDEPLGTEAAVEKPEYKDLNHIYTVNHNENDGVFAEWREILANFTESVDLRKILIAEVYGSQSSYYRNDSQPWADLHVDVELTDLSDNSTAVDLKEKIDLGSKLPGNAWPTFLVGSHDVHRLANRVGEDLVDAVHMITFIAKGTPITFYGDELGMSDIDENNKTLKGVMLWNNETNAGFSDGSTSLSVSSNYESINVQAQEKEKQSHLNIFKHLLALRGQPALGFGVQEYPILTNETFSMIRVRKGSPGYLVVANLGNNATVIDFTEKSDYLPEIGRVEIHSRNIMSGPLIEGDHPKIYLNNVPLEPKQAVVFSFVPQFKG